MKSLSACHKSIIYDYDCFSTPQHFPTCDTCNLKGTKDDIKGCAKNICAVGKILNLIYLFKTVFSNVLVCTKNTTLKMKNFCYTNKTGSIMYIMYKYYIHIIQVPLTYWVIAILQKWRNVWTKQCLVSKSHEVNCISIYSNSLFCYYP